MPFLDREQRLFITRLALATTTLVGVPVIAARDSNIRTERQAIPDLGLKIDEVGWFKVIDAGPKWGVLPKTADKNKLGCPNWSPNICMGESTTNFQIALNGPMANFMFKESRISNPILPVKILIIEDWLEINNREHVAGFTGITGDEKEIHIILSLKATAWNVFKAMDRQSLPMEYFEGSLSFLLSRNSVHELGHGGAEAKALAKPGRLVPEPGLADITHSQVYVFDDQYGELYRLAENRRQAEGALIFGVQPKEDLNLSAYKNQLYQEAIARGLENN